MSNKPLDSKIHKMKGNYRPSRHGEDQNELKVELRAPKKPDYLTLQESEVWDWLIKNLSEWNILTPADEIGLVGICKLHSKMKFKSDDMTASDYGQLRSYLSEYGLTPSARTKLKPQGNEKPDNPFSDLD